MKQEDKELLLHDLCARLPYGVICKAITKEYDSDNRVYVEEEVTGVLVELHHYKCIYGLVGLMDECDIETIKPYLRPMSSMTEEEECQFTDYYAQIKAMMNYLDFAKECGNLVNWLLKNHFDFRGLIPKGLAIEVTEENNPYKTEE